MVERVNRFLLFLYFLRKEGKRRRRGILRLSAPVDGRREGGGIRVIEQYKNESANLACERNSSAAAPPPFDQHH